MDAQTFWGRVPEPPPIVSPVADQVRDAIRAAQVAALDRHQRCAAHYLGCLADVIDDESALHLRSCCGELR